MVVDDLDGRAFKNEPIVGYDDLVQHGIYLFRRIQHYQPGPELLDIWKPFQVVGVVAAHFEDTRVRPLPFYRFVQVLAAEFHPFF